MEKFTILHLIDFSPLIQLAAGFFVLFIVIDYTKSFSSLLSKHLFDFHGTLKKKMDKYRLDKESCLQRFIDNGHFREGNGKKSLEDTKDKIDKLNATLNDKRKETESVIADDCRCDVFRYMSIYMFLYCLTTLFVAGLRVSELASLHYLVIYSGFSYLTAIFATCINHRFRKCSDRNGVCLLVTLGIIIASFLLPVLGIALNLGLSKLWLEIVCNTTVISSVILPYIVFLMYILIIWWRSKSIFCKIDEIDNLKTEYQGIQEEISAMHGYVNQEEREKELENARNTPFDATNNGE